MGRLRKTLISPRATILESIERIDASGLQIALVVDEEHKLLGTVTDGDIRRGILRGISLDRTVKEVMNRNPIVGKESDGRDVLVSMMKSKGLHHIPILSKDGRVQKLELLEDLLAFKTYNNWIVLMAGGLGSRLGSLTSDCPKPLLKVGSKPLLETIIIGFIEQGFRRFVISVNYKAEMIMDFFGDGSSYGVEIRYIQETKRLGTAGALSLMKEDIGEPFIVMNGDILTKVNYPQLLDFHALQQSMATMCVRDYELQIPYGVVKIEQEKLVRLEEKPVQHYFVNAGIYVLEKEALGYIPNDTFFDMPSLFEILMEMGHKTTAFPIREYWLDIGRVADYERANGDFPEVFE